MSGLGWGGPPSRLVQAAIAGQITLVSSPALLGELRRVLAYPRLAAVFSNPDAVVALVEDLSVVVEPTEHLGLVTDDDDNRVLEAALAGRADLVITGDRALLALERVRGVRILGPVAALALVPDEGGRE